MNIETMVTTGFRTGWLTVGESVVPLSSAPLITKYGVQLKAAAGNAGIVYVGGPDVTADQNATTGGYPLAASETLFIPVDHLEGIFLIADAVGQQVAKLVLK